jgi:hypothetical protein
VPINELLSFALAQNANVLPQANYANLPGRLQGFVSGVAESAHFNKVWRQSSFTSAMIAQFTMHNAVADVLDDSDVDGYEAKFARAVKALAGLRRATTTGTADHVLISFSPPFTAYAGMVFMADVSLNINAGADISVDGLGARLLKRMDGYPIQDDDAPGGASLIMLFDGTYVRVLDVSTYAIQHGTMNYGDDIGSSDALVVTLEPPLRRYKKGQRIWVRKGSVANSTTTPKIDVNGLGQKQIVKRNAANVSVGDLPANAWLPLGFDGTYWRVIGFVNSDLVVAPVPYFYVDKFGSQSIPGGSVNTIVNFGSGFTEKVGLNSIVMSGGVIQFGTDGGLYALTGGVITTSGVLSSEMGLVLNNTFHAVQANLAPGYGINSAVARMVRVPNGASLYIGVAATADGEAVLGSYGTGYNSTFVSGYKIAS